MPKAGKRDLSDDRDRRRVQEFSDVLPDERCTDNEAALLVDDELRASGVTVGVEARPAHRTEIEFDCPDSDSCLASLRLREPDSRNLRIGEHDARHSMAVVDEHRQWMLDEFASIAAEADASDAGLTAQQLMILRDGAMVNGHLGESASVAAALSAAFATVIAAANL